MRSVKIALAVAMVLLLVAVGVVLSRSPLTVAGSNSVQAPLYRNGVVPGGSDDCQPAGTVPRRTSAVRVSLGANVDPKIGVSLIAGSRLITQGTRGAGGGLNASVTVPVKSVPSTVDGASLCLTLGPSAELIGVRGIATRAPVENVSALGDVRLRFEYLRPGPKSWWSMVSSIAHRFGLGRAAPGTWIGFLVLAVMLTVAGLTAALTLKELR